MISILINRLRDEAHRHYRFLDGGGLERSVWDDALTLGYVVVDEWREVRLTRSGREVARSEMASVLDLTLAPAEGGAS